MNKIVISTDTNCSLTKQQALDLGIYLLSMPIIIDGNQYFEHETISYQQFMDKLTSGSAVSTSQPSLAALQLLWDEALKNNDYVIHIPMDSVLSGSYQSAVMLAKEYGGKVRVADVRRVSLPTFQAVLDCKKMIEKGLDVDEIMNRLNDNSDNYDCYVALGELEHLRKGGRISATSAFVGNVLSIKPIIKFDCGALKTVGKVHGIIKGENYIIEQIKKLVQTKYVDKKINYHIAYSCSEQEAVKFKEKACQILGLKDIMMAPLPASLACHIGPAARGIAVEEIIE